VCDGERLQPSRWKIRSTGTNIARRLWDQREQLRGEYEDVHDPDRALWPVQHPGVVLDAVLSSAHGACLGCQWIDVRGHSIDHSDWFERASIWPHRHQVSNGGGFRNFGNYRLRLLLNHGRIQNNHQTSRIRTRRPSLVA
jgi:hypothetical protein